MKKMIFGNGQKLSRRKFVIGSAALASGGLALGFKAPFDQALAQNGATEVNFWVAINRTTPAEELECDWKKVTTGGISPSRNLASKRAWDGHR